MSLDHASPFILQPLMSDLYQSQDLLDLSAPDAPVSPLPASPSSGSIFGTASSIAAAASRRAAAVASSAAGSPTSGGAGKLSSSSPDRARAVEAVTSAGKDVRCVEGYGPNLYLGLSDGTVEWWVCDGGAGTSKAQGWTMRHKHTLFPRRMVNKICLIPRVSKMLVLSDGTMHALSLPSLEPIPSSSMPPLRGVTSIILDDNEMEWGGPGSEDRNAEVTVVVVRRRGLGIYRVGPRMQPVKEIPLPSGPTTHALTHTYLCAALSSSGTYSLIDLSDASMTEVLPISQVDTDVLEWDPNPNIVVIPGEDEFLVTSYTGVGTMGVFLNGQGDPVRGTMEWDDHPISIAVDSGHIIALLRNQTITIHSLAELDKPVQTMILDPSLKAFGLSYSPYGVNIRDATRDDRMTISSITLLGGRLRPADPIAPTVPDKDVTSPPIERDALGLSPGVAVSGSESGILSPRSPSPALGSSTNAPTVAPINEPSSGSGLTPPSSPPKFPRQPITPKRQSSLLQSTAPPTIDGPFSTAVAETLVIGPNGITSIAPTPTILRVEKLCRDRDMESAIVMVDEERRKGRRGEVDADKATHQGTVRFLHLYLALHLFANGMFERAGEYFSRSKIDPRLIVRSFPTLRGKIIGSEEEVDIYDGLKATLEGIPTVIDIVNESVKRNFAPEVDQPTQDVDEKTEDVEDASNGQRIETEEEGEKEDAGVAVIRDALLETANAMLSEFLRKTRQSRRKGGGSRGIDSRKIDIVIDTTLAKLFALSGSTNDLLALLAAPNDCVLAEVEPFLHSKPYVLATVLRKQGRHERVLELLKKVAESEEPDPLCPDPLSEIAHELENVKDQETLRRYALWMISKDTERGMSILLAQTTSTKLDEQKLVGEIRAVSEEAANRYLEHVVVVKKSPTRSMHEDLLGKLLEAVEKEVADDGVQYHLEELDAEFRLLPDPEPFCVFLADIAPASPIKMLRLKVMLFLQGSPFFDLKATADRLEKVDQLKYERAIVLGRLGKNREALHLLAREVGDSISAQTYCTSAGEVIAPRVAYRVAQHVPELAAWAGLIEIGRTKHSLAQSQSAVDAGTQQGLVMELLGAYMRDGASTSKETAALLNAQSRHLDTLQVLDMVPPSWSVDVISSFTQRALRRQLHDRWSVMVLKSIAAGQNLQVAEEYLDGIRRVPPVVQRADPSAVAGVGAGADVGHSPGAESEKSGATDTTTTTTTTTTNSAGLGGVGGEKEKRGEDIGEGSVPEGSVGDRKEGYFKPEVVDKELRRVERRMSRASRGRDGKKV